MSRPFSPGGRCSRSSWPPCWPRCALASGADARRAAARLGLRRRDRLLRRARRYSRSSRPLSARSQRTSSPARQDRQSGRRCTKRPAAATRREIACNVLTGALMLLLHALTGHSAFRWAYAGAMAASLADSMASGLGVLSKRSRGHSDPAPADEGPLRRRDAGRTRRLPAGRAADRRDLRLRLGLRLALLPRRRARGLSRRTAGQRARQRRSGEIRCPECGALTEKPRHCGVPGTPRARQRFRYHDLVNLCNNLAGAALALALSALVSGA